MINSVNVPAQSVLKDGNILFGVDRVRTKSCQCGGWIEHDAGSGLFTIIKPGIYEISFNANISLAAPGVASMSIKANGEGIGGTNMLANIVTANTLVNISSSTLVQIPCGTSKTISVGNNTALTETVQDANIIIKRIA